MIIIPFQINEQQYSVYIGLGDDSIERIKQYDPAELIMRRLPAIYQALELKDVVVGYCSDEDLQQVQRLINEDGKPFRALRHLTRGWQFRPDRGDHDGPALSIKVEPNETKQ